MTGRTHTLREQAARLVRPTQLPALIAAVVVALFGLVAASQDSALVSQQAQAEVRHRLGLVRAELEGNIRGDVMLARGLAAAIATEPDMPQPRFAALVEHILDTDTNIRHVAGAPDLVVSLLHPVAGNEAALGLDYRTLDQQRDAALRAREAGELVLAGPVDLVQGGRGLILRQPVFHDEGDAGEAFWGILSTVVDVDKLYAHSGLLDPDLPIDIAILGRDALGAAGEQFFGDPAILDADPITDAVGVPGGTWRLAAIPKGGWAAATSGTQYVWLFTLAAGLLVVVPTSVTGLLVEERRRHIAELRSREVRLARLSRRLELALATSKIAVWELDLDTGGLYWDDRMNELYGYAADGGQRGYKHWAARVAPADRERARQEFDQACARHLPYRSEFRIEVAGQVRTVRAIGRVYVTPDGARKIVGVNWDVTADVALNEDLRHAKALTDARNVELEAARASIEHNSLHDFLTGLPNRMYLDKVLEEHARRCADGGGGIVLLHLDLDRFKEINDTLGHAAGDAMLMRAAERISDKLEESDFVARTGGDEFVVVRRTTEGAGAAEALARALVAEMQKPVIFEGRECRFGVSIGIAAATGAEVDRERLLVNADIALYRAKHRGRNRYEIFDASLQARIISRKQTADSILKGLENGEFVPYYQPQFDARTLEVVGVEALARWRHPARGIQSPDAFVQIAEEIGVLAQIDRTVLEQGLEDFRHWRAAGVRVPRLSVNVSARRLHDEHLIGALRRLEIEPGTLSFELVESIYLDTSDDISRANIRALADIGVEIEIDDFGSGYASIVSLMNLRPQRLKIDRQIIKPITTSKAQVNLVQSIMEIGKSLGIEVVAEGVETMQHARLLREMGCNVLQGFALARPMPADDVIRFAVDRQKRVVA